MNDILNALKKKSIKTMAVMHISITVGCLVQHCSLPSVGCLIFVPQTVGKLITRAKVDFFFQVSKPL